MNLKKLTQAVFEGLPKEYRWAVVDSNQSCWVSSKKPERTDECQWIFGNVSVASLKSVGGAFDTTDWQNSLIERLDVPTADKPESITDVARSIEAARVAEKSGNRCATCTANICSVIDDCYVQRAKEESARIEEQACIPWPDGDPRHFETSDVPETKKYPHYFKDVSDVDAIDLYHVARLYDITDPALFHAFKKIACAGKRGTKDQAQDVQEAIDALKRWQELNV